MAGVLQKIRGAKKDKKRDSLYSVVSSSDVTPGSLEVWVDLPDDIKYDPALATFKRLYEQHHGKIGEVEDSERDDKNVPKGVATLTPLKETQVQEEDDDGTRDSGNRLLQSNQSSEEKEETPRQKKIAKTLRIVKLSALVACWIFLTVALLLNREKTDVLLHTAVSNGQINVYELQPIGDKMSILVTLQGPFEDTRSNDTNLLEVWLSRRIGNTSQFWMEQNSTTWYLRLPSENKLDFATSKSESKVLNLYFHRNEYNYTNDEEVNATVSLRLTTTSASPVGVTLSYHLDPVPEENGILYAAALLGFLYVFIIFEIINRTIAALVASTLSVAVLALCGVRPSLPELVSWLDMETLLLLFSMMLLVAILAETGLFDYLAVLAFEVTSGRTWPLITCLCLFTAVFSTFLDNVTTVLLMTPVTIRLCEVMQLNPVPVLMSMVIFSNVGGAATPVGDPPNVIIASHPSVLNEGINFATFTVHMGVGILMVGVQTYFQLRYMFRDMSTLRHSVPNHILELRHELAAWKRAAASLSSYSRDEDIVRRALEKKAEKMNATLSKKESGGGVSKTDPTFCSTLAQMKQKYKIRDKQLLIKSTISVSFVVIVFFLHAFPELQRLSLGWTALLGALLLLILAEKEDLEPILARVEWSTLLFFAALFVLMEALSKLGLISWIGNMTESVILMVNKESQLAVAIMLVLWVSGLASAFVDNIPLTTMMVRVTAALADPAGLGLPLAPLVWALSFGACLGGNGTLIGASANVVCAGVAEQHGYRFTFLQYLKIGFPVMIGNLLVSSVYLLLCHCVFQWH